MSDFFDIANLITTVGVDGVKIKHEPGLPEKSSNEILTELFSTFDVDEGIVFPLINSDCDDNNDKSKKKKKKSKKKHKHKDKKHKKKSKKHSSDTESEVDIDGIINKKKKKHKKTIKRKRETDSSNSTDLDEPKIKKECISPQNQRKSKDYDDNKLKTVFDLVESVIKKEPGIDDNKYESKNKSLDSPILAPLNKELNDDLEDVPVPRLLGEYAN